VDQIAFARQLPQRCFKVEQDRFHVSWNTVCCQPAPLSSVFIAIDTQLRLNGMKVYSEDFYIASIP
jgi:hypothetical protein